MTVGASADGGSSGRWPSGHLAWFFDGIHEFEGGATTFLAEGAAIGERLMLVADDPRVDLWPQSLIERGQLIVASTAEVYGPDCLVVAEAQRETFTAALEDALKEGYSGIRVAADNTSLTLAAERQEAWTRWEGMADRFMAENPVTGLCGFDRTRAEPSAVAALQQLHAVSVSD